MHERRLQEDTFPPGPLLCSKDCKDALCWKRCSFTWDFATGLDLLKVKAIKTDAAMEASARPVQPMTYGQFTRQTEIPGTRHRQDARVE